MLTGIGIAAAAVLLCTGTVLGATWTSRILQSRLRQRAWAHAEERRILAKEWEMLREQRTTCPRCTSPRSDRDSYPAPAVVQD
ncbi:MAG: hypothetical protein ACRDSH_20565 [Pseudonocardiaceae bacterium]